MVHCSTLPYVRHTTKKTGTNVTGLRFSKGPYGVESHSAAGCLGWSTASWCSRGTARLRSRATGVTAVAAETLFEHPGKQATTWFAAWITARFRFAAHRCRCAACWSLHTTGLWLRAAWVATRRLGLETTKEARFCGLRGNETAQYSHGQQGKNTSH
jgi:hypothetical protein